MEQFTTFIGAFWPVFVGFITLVVVLAKMHTSIQVIEEKVKVLFELHNRDHQKNS